MKTLLAVVALVPLVGVAGTMDYQDELKETKWNRNANIKNTLH